MVGVVYVTHHCPFGRPCPGRLFFSQGVIKFEDMTTFWKLIFGGGKTSIGVDAGLLILRLWIGLPMAFVYGRGKLPPSPQFVSGVESLGFPVPYFFAWCAVMAEVVGGALLAMGLMTRPAAFFLGFTMCVAVFKAKGEFGLWDLERMNPTHFLIGAVVLFFTGAGKASIDVLLRPKHREMLR